MGTKEIVTIVVVNVFAWAYTIICLIKGKEIKVKCDCGNAIAYNILFGILGVMLILYKFNYYSLLTALSLQLAATLLGSIPSGYSDKGVYIHGRRFLYRKISEMNIVLSENKYRLDIRVKGKTYFLYTGVKDKKILEDIVDKYEGEHIL